jgi:hypothetical protein
MRDGSQPRSSTSRQDEAFHCLLRLVAGQLLGFFL